MDTGFKVPIKRKIDPGDGKGSKVKKAGDANSDDSDNESRGSNWSDCSQGDLNASGERLAVKYKAFCKGNRNVEVEFYFPDRPQFINDVSCFIRKGAFTEKEVARLRKFLTILRKKVNGDLSAPFKVKRGVRQGCPMSGMLYAIAIEPLLHKLRPDLRGFSVPCCLVLRPWRV